MKHIAPFIVLVLVFLVISFIIINVLNYRLKKTIIESGPIDDNALKVLNTLSGIGPVALKWGIVLLFAGIGLAIIELLPQNWQNSTVPYGVEAILIALGFLVYYFVDVKRNKKR